MKIRAIIVPAPEGGFTAYTDEIPGAISEGETLQEVRDNLADAARMVLACNRELAAKPPRMDALREACEVADLERHLRAHGCKFCHENPSHAIWRNPANQKTATVPLHRTIKHACALNICKALDIPKP